MSTGSALTEPEEVSAVTREAFEVLPGPVGAVQINRIHNYLTKTGVKKEFCNLLQMLLSRDELPYNPYPGFAVRLRPFLEKFYTDKAGDDKIEFALSVPLMETQLLHLYTVKEGGPVWGLRSLLSVLDTSIINRYRWLSDNLTPSYSDLYQKEGYTNQVMVVLVGAALFHGSFYQQVHIAQYRLEFVITGKLRAEAISIFVSSVILDVEKLSASDYHILIGVNVPVLSSSSETEEVWLLEFWDPETIRTYKGELMQKISDAVLGNKYILAECVFHLDPFKAHYIQGQKQYTLSFIQVQDDGREEGLINFAEFPMASLHEGIFLNQSHAESYISMFSPHLDMADSANILHASARPTPGPLGKTARKFSSGVEDDYQYIHRHIHQRLQQYKPRKARIDGFRLGDDSGSGPFAWQITSPIKSNLQKRIVSFHPCAQLFDIVYHMILLVLMERKISDTPLLIELYKLGHSTAGQLHMLGEKNKAVRALLRGFMNKSDGHRIRQFLLDYKKDIDEFLAHSLHDGPSDLRVVGHAMSTQVTSMLEVSDQDLGSPAHLNLIVLMLRDQNSFMLTTLMRLSEDVLHWCPLVKDQIQQLHKNFPECIPRPASNTRDPQAAGARDKLPKATSMRHGFEDRHIMTHENSTIVVARCLEQNTSKIMGNELVLIKYIVDTHLDETWEKFLEELFLCSDLPANPYPALITKLRACAMKMDLCFEPESMLLDQVLTKSAKTVDEENFVYQLSGCQAFGPATAVALLDPEAFVPLLQCVQDYLTNKAYIQRKGPIRIGICLGITGPASLYGKMKPYLTQLDLHEHYYMQGPSGCHLEAVLLFAAMIQKHIEELVASNSVPILGVFLGKVKNRWSWEEVINKKQDFISEVESMVLHKEPVFLKAYTIMEGWRYVPVFKYFLLHYMQDGELGTITFYQEEPFSFYCAVFSSPERAAFHYQNGGPLRGGNPLSSSNVHIALVYMDEQLRRLRDKVDFMEAYRLLVYRSLISDDTEHILEAWRMFHSIAGQAEYVASLSQALAELVEYEIECAKFSSLHISEASPSGQESLIAASSVNLGIVSAMVKALLDKSQIVTEWRISMCAVSLSQFIWHKVKNVTEVDRRTGSMYPIMQEMTVLTLEEIAHMFRNIQTTVCGDIHNMSERALHTYTHIDNQPADRPVSIESQVLNDPQVYQQRPHVEQKLVQDDVLYKPRHQKMYKPKVQF